MNDRTKSIIGILIIVAFFIFSSYIVQNNFINTSYFVDNSLAGMLTYVLILVIATVIAPVNAMPLLSIASNLWGWVFAAILSIIGWTLGAVVAFLLARKYGMPLVKKFAPLAKVKQIADRIPKHHIFWSIVFLRMAIPVDILSYILGLFSRIKFRTYFFATLIGISPFAFVFAFLGSLPFYYQIIVLFFALLFILIGLLIALRFKKKKKSK
ncbi:MAG: hypothetical protein UR46_C0025G0005 [Parcubacteria group bacterium GW2011_GWA1_33_6]|nr:MAG: hypothetical protein UR46_C0025G0005 [Parcubacteria group bacterium GW2011_GWA1_33_6]